MPTWKPPVPVFSAPARTVLGGGNGDDDDDDDGECEDLTVVGYASTVFRDDETASRLDHQQHLQLWMENKAEDLWIDRYDARALLSDTSYFAKRKQADRAPAPDGAEELMLDAERYRDLPPADNEAAAAPGDSDHGDAEALGSTAPSNQFGAVHFAFGSQPGAQQAQQPVTPPEIAAFAQGWLTELAPGSALPQTFKQHQIIEKTAKFVHKEGKKMEAMLKIKHGGNAAFQFLLVDHALQPYYQAIVKYLGYCPQAVDLPTLLPAVEAPAEFASEEGATAGSEAPRSPDAAAEESATHEEVSGSGIEMVEKAGSGGAQDDVKGAAQEAAAGSALAAATDVGQGDTQSGSASVVAAATPAAIAAAAVPPDDILQTIDKLVRWILKSGRDFEKKVKERQRNDPRFDFLLPWSPYNAFYRQMLEDAFNGKLDDPAPAPVPTAQLPALPPVNDIGATSAGLRVGEGESGDQPVASGMEDDKPKVQDITSFGYDSDHEQDQAQEGAPSDDAHGAGEEEGDGTSRRKERSSRFGPDLSEAGPVAVCVCLCLYA